MFMRSSFHHRRGFSTLMALGTISVLLILVTGLATTYMREMRLSRATYDEILAKTAAEGMFEYAMLKVRNHHDGFSEHLSATDVDGSILTPTTDRSKNLKMDYTIDASATGSEFSLAPDTHLIVPLFTAPGNILSPGQSKSPDESTIVEKTVLSRIEPIDTLSWTLIGSASGKSLGLSGSGNITPDTIGIIRENKSQCYDAQGSLTQCDGGDIVAERLEYFADTKKTVGDFLTDVENPYFMVYNNTSQTKTVSVQSDGVTSFSLPTLTVTAQAQKNDSLQTFRFVEDKSRYYDALKYGIYNDGN